LHSYSCTGIYYAKTAQHTYMQNRKVASNVPNKQLIQGDTLHIRKHHKIIMCLESHLTQISDNQHN